ncbi:hypothetical protein HZB90_02380, partial [archaeon]|nr:hypothetical protein [archaeon]
DSRVYEKVLEISKLMMGFEIIENTERSCRLVNISTKLEQNFDALIIRLFLGGISFGKELLSRLMNQKSGDIKSLLEYEFNSNRLALFCMRILQKGSVNQDKYSSISLYNIVASLERYNDNFRDIILVVGDSEARLNKNTIELFKGCIAAQELNFKIFNQLVEGKDVQSKLDLFKEHKSIRLKSRNRTNILKSDETNNYISAKLIEAIEISHHINEELFF